MSRCELHMHSTYSLLDGFATPKEYLERAREIGLKGIAITEHGNLYSSVYFDELKSNYPEIKMMYGVELYECFDINIEDKDEKYFHLIAIAKNEKGRIALNEIVTKSNFEGFYYKPRVDLNMLKPYAEDLIISSACLASKLSREKDYARCLEYILEYKSIFPHFYLEMQSHKHIDQELYNQKILKLSEDTSTPYIITTDSHAATKEDLYYQARLVQIAHDTETLSEMYEGCYLQTNDEIHEIMDLQIGVDNVSIGLENSLKVMGLIEDVNMPFQEPQLPTFPLPSGYRTNMEYLKHLATLGWDKRGFDNMTIAEQKERQDRLEYELKIISQMRYEGYFLIVWDFINYAKENGVMVGAGRGSAGGSLVCYLLGISELDPIKYHLIFERFLNPERVSMPDIDLDFSDRDKVIKYLMGKYGEQSVCQIINFTYITPIVAIKDVGRVLKIPYKICDKISKKFTYPTFEECMENNPSIMLEFSEYLELFDIASKISGRVRNASVHAGGVGIVDTKVTDYMAMKLGSNGEHVIQVDKVKVEAIGIIKLDILGVTTLTMMQEIVNDAGIDLWDIDINNESFASDEKAYQILKNAQTNAVFQVESQGMKDLLLRLQPDNLEDLSAILALYRPDSMSMLEDYIYYKHNPELVSYWHDDMKPILDKTYGCIIYQEQIMNIVRVFGGRTYGGADKFRKGIGKKDKELVKFEADKLYQEIITNKYDNELSRKISEYMATMGGYSFNKSHSALYSVITLQTAYLKAHYPVHFFKALLNLNKNDYGSLNKYIIDAKSFGIEILPPHINRSGRNFSIYENKILFGLEAIKGVGEKFVDKILEARQDGKFKDFNDFIGRLRPSKSQVIALVKSGAIPAKNKYHTLLEYAQSIFSFSEYEDVISLPTLKKLQLEWDIDTNIIKDKEARLRIYNEKREYVHTKQQNEKYLKHVQEFEIKYLQNEKFWEFESLSIFLKNNPFEKVYDYIRPFEEIDDGLECVIVGIVANVTKKKDRHGKQFAFIGVYSAFGLMDITCWHSQYKEYQDLLKRGSQLAFYCNKNDEKATIKEIKLFDKWLEDAKLIL